MNLPDTRPAPAESDLTEHLPYVYCSLRRLGVRAEDADDLAHDVFVVALRKRPKPSTGTRPWLFAIAHHLALHHFRRQRRSPEVLDDASWPDPAQDASAGPEARAEAAQRLRRLLAAVAALEPDRRAVFIMHDVDGHSAPDISEALEVPLNTVYSRLRLARAELAGTEQPDRDGRPQALLPLIAFLGAAPGPVDAGALLERAKHTVRMKGRLVGAKLKLIIGGLAMLLAAVLGWQWYAPFDLPLAEMKSTFEVNLDRLSDRGGVSTMTVKTAVASPAADWQLQAPPAVPCGTGAVPVVPEVVEPVPAGARRVMRRTPVQPVMGTEAGP